MVQVFFFTHNRQKFLYAKRIFSDFGLRLIQKTKTFSELRGNCVESIARDKLKQINIAKHPFLVEDSGFFIESLHGFPGGYINFVIETIGVTGLVKLVENKKRHCFFESVVGVHCGGRTTFFAQIDKGEISTTIARKNNGKIWSQLWKIFAPTGYSKPLALFSANEMKTIELQWLKNSNFKRAALFIKKNCFN